MSTNNDMAILAKLRQILGVAEDIVRAEEFTWENRYDLIFSNQIARQVSNLFHASPIVFDYYDPDSSYEDDVTAFVDALEDHIEKLASFASRHYSDGETTSDLMNRYNAL